VDRYVEQSTVHIKGDLKARKGSIRISERNFQNIRFQTLEIYDDVFLNIDFQINNVIKSNLK